MFFALTNDIGEVVKSYGCLDSVKNEKIEENVDDQN